MTTVKVIAITQTKLEHQMRQCVRRDQRNAVKALALQKVTTV